MTTDIRQDSGLIAELCEYDEPVDRVQFDFSNLAITVSRRQFVQVLGAGILIAVAVDPSDVAAQNPNRGGRGGRGGGRPTTVAARLHIAKDGTITLLTGKVECGQGARAELTQAAAEELRVAAERIAVLMADTGLVPNDGITAGSGSTPRTLPAIRQAAALPVSFSSSWPVAAGTSSRPTSKCATARSFTVRPSASRPMPTSPRPKMRPSCSSRPCRAM